MPKLSSYRVIAVGVNVAKDQEPLQYAEHDARRVFETFTGGLGPARIAESWLLLGDEATRSDVIDALRAAAELSTTYLLFYFSGHGGPEGICLANGVLSYRALRRELSRVNSRCTLIMLDSCHAGAYVIETGRVAGLEEDWADVLASATPGTRMFFATSATAYSRESDEVRHGHFTYSLLQALHTGTGSIHRGQLSWISDREVFRRARSILRRRWPNDAEPQSRKLGGEFPVLLSQAEGPIGYGEVTFTLRSTSITADVSVRVLNRRNVRTRLVCSLHDEGGDLLEGARFDVVPDRNDREYTKAVGFPLSSIMNATSTIKVARGRAVRTYWHVRLIDPHHDHLLHEQKQAVSYRYPASAWV